MAASTARLLLIDPADVGLASSLRDQLGSVECRPAFAGAPVAGYDVVAVNYDALADDDRAALVAHFSGDRTARLVVISDAAAPRDYVTLFGRHAATNLVACNHGEVDRGDLVVTLRKLVEPNIFGLDQYVACGPSALRLELHTTDDKPRALAEIEAYALAAGLHPRLVEHGCIAADEFITNAFYNAPLAADGRPRYAHLPRTEPVVLDADEAIAVTVAHDGRRLGLSTVDPFGSLTEARLLDYLAKCFRGGEGQVDRKAGGAGLGLFLAFKGLSHFVVNIEPGKRTEMIGLIEAHASYRAFARRNKSFNVFTA